MKIFAVSEGFNFGKIYECEVIEETEKTYIVRVDGWKHTVKKSSMSVYDYQFCKTYNEIVAKKKEILINRINREKQRIEQLKGYIAKCESMLVDLEKEQE